MTVLVNIGGEIRGLEDARISVLDRGFLYGDSVYEVVRTYGGRIFSLEEHLDRLDRSASRIGIPLPERSWLAEEMRRTVEEAGNPETYCRVIVTRGGGPISLDPAAASEAAAVIIAKEYEPFPDWTYERGIKVAIPNIRRTSRTSLDPAIKSGNYLNSVLALGEARRAGFYDALMLDHQGLVTEATSSNVFVAKDGRLRTPALEFGLLAGVTRGFVIRMARENGIQCDETELTVEDLESSDEAMLTSTLREVQPIVQVGDRILGDGRPGPMVARLRVLFSDLVRARMGAAS